MERVHTLIEKLYQQHQQNASPAHLLFTVQMIHAELLQIQQKPSGLGTPKVAVSLPVNLNFVDELVRSALQGEEEAAAMIKEAEKPSATATTATPVQPAAVPQPEAAPYSLPRPAAVEATPTVISGTPMVIEFEPKVETPAPAAYVQPEPAAPVVKQPEVKAPAAKQPEIYEPVVTPAAPPSYINPAMHMEADMPTLSQYGAKPAAPKVEAVPEKEVYELKPNREIHELLGNSQESLNDRLKEEKTELGHKLTGSPIKDLRKAIGINDRFTFINELFRGDEAMYERSLKTINDFNVYSEAEYWINRELTFKLGWVETQSIVQHFYHLVRRRFS